MSKSAPPIDSELRPLSGDRPIESISEDRLGYAGFAKALAVSIHGMAPSEGLVLAVGAVILAACSQPGQQTSASSQAPASAQSSQVVAASSAITTIHQRGTAGLEEDGGTYVLPVLINNTITLKFTIDSGASDVSIPADVAHTLVRSGTITSDDFIGTQTFSVRASPTLWCL